MAVFTERKVKDRIEILEDGVIQVREATIVERDGVEISRTFHRYVLEPDSDVTNEENRIKDITNAIWTPAAKAAYSAKKAARANNNQ